VAFDLHKHQLRAAKAQPGFARATSGLLLAITRAWDVAMARRKEIKRRAGRPPAGAREGEKVKDYPQISFRVPVEFKARLTAMSTVTGLAQWRVIVEAIDCFFDGLSDRDREIIKGLSERMLRAG
jgi:predicted DNA-binding protein